MSPTSYLAAPPRVVPETIPATPARSNPGRPRRLPGRASGGLGRSGPLLVGHPVPDVGLHVGGEVRHEGPGVLLAGARGLPEAGPGLRALAEAPRRVGLALVGDVVGLQRVGLGE